MHYISKLIVRVGRSIAITSQALTIATFKISHSSPYLFLPLLLPTSQPAIGTYTLFSAKLHPSAA